MDPAFQRAARETFIFGENYEGYWTCELLLANVRKAAAIAMFKYPREGRMTKRPCAKLQSLSAFTETSTTCARFLTNPAGTMRLQMTHLWLPE